MKKTILVALFLLLTLIFVGCNEEKEKIDISIDTSFSKTEEEMFTDRDKASEYSQNLSHQIALNETTISSTSKNVLINDTVATITAEGVFELSGSLENGYIIVDAPTDAKVQLVLKGVKIASLDFAPIYIKNANKVFITLEGENILTNGGSFESVDENNVDSVIFSKQDLTLNGNGKLSIDTSFGHGIVSKDDLVITYGEYEISAGGHGLDANNSIRLLSPKLEITSYKDGLHVENADDSTLGYIYISNAELLINTQGDGLDASSNIQIEDGKLTITTSQNSDGNSMKGVKATGTILVNNGEISISALDDSLHANESIVINGGAFELSSADDGIHADVTLKIGSSTINIKESYEGLEALNVEIHGGNITLRASDDGINSAGGNDSSGTGGAFGGDNFGRPQRPGPGGVGGGSSASNGTILISGGRIYINAYGDGIDANGSITITGGHTTVCGPTTGDTAVLDYDTTATLTGGTFIGTGSSMMAQTFSECSQGIIALSVGNQSSGTKITIEDADGKEIFSYEPNLPYQIVIITTSELKKGQIYKISVGSLSGNFEA